MKFFMRYMKSRFEQNNRDFMYRIYISDGLRAIARIDKRYIDIVNGSRHNNEKKIESADEIKQRIGNMIERLGGG